jgi:hypothetical protein
MNGVGGRGDWESFLSVPSTSQSIPDIHNLAAEFELDLSVVETNNELLRTADLEVLYDSTYPLYLTRHTFEATYSHQTSYATGLSTSRR